MQEYMITYNKNIEDIEQFIAQTISNIGSLDSLQYTNYEKLFDVFPSLELVYVCDEQTLKQTSNNIYRDNSSAAQIGVSRNYLLKKLKFKYENVAISSPYISSATGAMCITAAKKANGKIYFLDFNLEKLLQRLGLIEIHQGFNLLSKSFYLLASLVMMILAFITIGYSMGEIFDALLVKNTVNVEAIFKPIIAITLGLAVFDLGKTILEQEVVFKSYTKSSKQEYRVLTKFSITILIALMIESLMVVFKIAMEDYAQMINAVYLIVAVAIFMATLGLFVYLSKKSQDL
ncbi:MAG: PDC sensor domain-containing protein [Campylobacterales bacterium]|nr:PDC sensor domain-containing protein [Campylobacterales bacterium]